jgi:hypothetical protein
MEGQTMDRPRHFRLAIWGVVLAASLALPGAAVAGHEPNAHASCRGIEMAAISPPGTSDEELGGAPQFVSEIKEFAGFFGVPAGLLFSWVASLHEGSHDLCDEALEAGP